jgi:hypothetical protein
VAIKSSDWRKKARELMARKWAEKPHGAEVVCMNERNRFESWVRNCPHSLTGISQLPKGPQTNAEGMSQSATFTIFITSTSESPFYLILAFYNLFLVIQNVRRNHMLMVKTVCGHF